MIFFKSSEARYRIKGIENPVFFFIHKRPTSAHCTFSTFKGPCDCWNAKFGQRAPTVGTKRTPASLKRRSASIHHITCGRVMHTRRNMRTSPLISSGRVLHKARPSAVGNYWKWRAAVLLSARVKCKLRCNTCRLLVCWANLALFVDGLKCFSVTLILSSLNILIYFFEIFLGANVFGEISLETFFDLDFRVLSIADFRTAADGFTITKYEKYINFYFMQSWISIILRYTDHKTILWNVISFKSPFDIRSRNPLMLIHQTGITLNTIKDKN